MRRKCMEKLLQWKKNPKRKPLVLIGGRQTGKTWLLQEFGEKNYENVIYINLETERPAADFLNSRRDAEEILLFLESYGGKPLHQGKTLLILDNFHHIPDGPAILAAIGLDFPGCHAAAIERGGLASASRHDTGDTEILELFPMDFEEFLWANKEYSLAKEIQKHFQEKSPMGKSLHQRAESQFRLFCCIGGMPAAVCEYRKDKKLLMVPDVQAKILSLMEADIISRAPEGMGYHARSCFRSAPAQLCKENGKFQYKQVVKGGTAKVYQGPLQWLARYGLLFPSPRKEPGMDIGPGITGKYYFPDTGLAACRLGIPPFLILSGEMYPQARGLREMFLAQCFIQNGYHLSYWTSGNQASVPFLLEKDGEQAAVDFRISPGEKARNLARYKECGGSGRMYLISTEDFHQKELYDVIPFYAAFCI